MSEALLISPATPMARASHVPPPKRPNVGQLLCLALGAFAASCVFVSGDLQKDVEADQLASCEVLARAAGDDKADAPLQVQLSYAAWERRPEGFSVKAQPAGSAGQLRQYSFTLLRAGLQGVTLRAPGTIEKIRWYTPDDVPIAHLSASELRHDANFSDARGVAVIIKAPADGSAPAGWSALPGLAQPVITPYGPIAGWGAGYAIALLALGWLLNRLFAGRGSLDLRPAVHAIARWIERARPWQLGLAVGLALAMAAVSAPNAHPDEYQHVAAARFYRNGGWLPPAVDNPLARDAIGPNGLSYNQDLDIVYLFAGKVSLLTQWLTSREDVAVRLFNVGLFAMLAVAACRRQASWALLISAQLWYVFSCFNGDGMGFFLSMLIVWQMADRDTVFGRSLFAERWKFGGLLWMGLLLGLVAISKKNYFVMPLLAAGWALWQWSQTHDRRLLVRWAAVAAIAASIYGARVTYDQALYGFHKADRIRDIAERLATPEYKPSAVGKPGAHWYMGMRENGVPPLRLLLRPRWRDESFMSFTGFYGWLTIAGPDAYYTAMRILMLAFATAVGFEWLRDATQSDLLLLTGCLALCGVCVAASIYYSWTVAFQPQGRYLFPMLPILAAAGMRKPGVFAAPAPVILSAALFCASVWSFVFVGLAAIPK